MKPPIPFPAAPASRAAAALVTVGAALALAACAPVGVVPGSAPGAAPATHWKSNELQAVVDYVRAQKSTGLLILQDGRVVAEHTWPLPPDAASFRATFVHGQAGDGALLEDVASMQKSFVAVLAGVAVDQGLLDVARPVSAYAGAGWSRAAPEREARITVRHLMEMTSGLKENLSPEFEPGTRFFYNTPAYAVLKKALEGATKRPLDELTRQWMTEPLGMRDTAWRERPPALADAANPTGLVTTPRDMARLGQMILDRGLAPDGRRVISAAQLDALLTRTPTNPGYGRLWWLNGGSHLFVAGPGAPRREGPLVPAAPPDMVAAHGFLERRLFVVPSLKLIVVRSGQGAPDKDFNQQLWTRLMRAAP